MSKIFLVSAAVCAMALGSSAYGQCCSSNVVVFDSSPTFVSGPVYDYSNDCCVARPARFNRLGFRGFAQYPVYTNVAWSQPIEWQPVVYANTFDNCCCNSVVAVEQPFQTMQSTQTVIPTAPGQVVESPVVPSVVEEAVIPSTEVNRQPQPVEAQNNDVIDEIDLGNGQDNGTIDESSTDEG